MNLPEKASRAIAASSCLAAAAAVLAPTSPAYQPVPGIDSGATLAVARAMLRGARPYADAWDHQGPVLYFINAVGLLIPLPGVWGVWLVRVLLLAAGAWAAHATLKRALGAGPAACAIAALVAQVALFVEDGNFTEEYALSLGLLALAAGAAGWMATLGALGAAAFLLSQNLAVPFMVLALTCAWQRLRAANTEAATQVLARAVVGAAVVIVPVLGFLAIMGAFPAYWNAAFVYNRIGASGSLGSQLTDAVRRVLSGSRAPLALLLALGWAEALRRRLTGVDAASKPLLSFAIVALPLELLAVALSANAGFHHYLPLMMPGVVLVAAVARLVADASSKPRSLWGYALPSMVIAAGAVTTWLGLFDNAGSLPKPSATVTWLAQNTAPSDPVVVWGAEPGLLVAANRTSPGPYFYADPLLKIGFAPYRDVGRYIAELSAHPPRAIIDASASSFYAPPLDRRRRASWHAADPSYAAGPDLEPLFTWIETHYRPDMMIGPSPPWFVFVPVEKPPEAGK